MSKECSATSLGMSGMSEGLHANMSAFVRRKSTSTTSYLGSRLELILNALPSEALGLREMSLVSSTGSKLSAWHLGSGMSEPIKVGDQELHLGDGLGLLNALNVALVCMLACRADGDDAVGA